jgi:hypothetical protein
MYTTVVPRSKTNKIGKKQANREAEQQSGSSWTPRRRNLNEIKNEATKMMD